MPPRSPVTWVPVTPPIASILWMYAVRSPWLATWLTTASIGAVELAGNSLFSWSDTSRAVEPAGSEVAPAPPQEILRNGAPRASRMTTITVT